MTSISSVYLDWIRSTAELSRLLGSASVVSLLLSTAKVEVVVDCVGQSSVYITNVACLCLEGTVCPISFVKEVLVSPFEQLHGSLSQATPFGNLDQACPQALVSAGVSIAFLVCVRKRLFQTQVMRERS